MSKILEFLKNIIKKAWQVVTSFVKETIANAPAAIILGTSAVGITSLLSKTSVSSLFIPVPFINETMICVVIAILITYSLALLTQVWYEPA